MNSHRGLRGRHTRFVPRLEALEDRCCPSTIEVSGSTMVIIGDSTDNAVTIHDNGSGTIDATITGVGDPVTAMATGISNFVIYTQGGFDTINYSRGTTISTGLSLGPAAYQVTLNVLATGGFGGFVLVTVQPGFAPGVPVNPVDLSWSDDGLVGPATVAPQTPFTLSRTYTVSGQAAGPFTIAYYGSVDDIFGNEDDFLLGTETIKDAGTRAGTHSGTSPAFQISTPGTFFLFARLDSDSVLAEADEANNLVLALQPVVVEDPTGPPPI